MAEIVSIFFLFMFSVPCQVVADVGRRMAAGVEPVLDCLHCSLQRGESHRHIMWSSPASGPQEMGNALN